MLLSKKTLSISIYILLSGDIDVFLLMLTASKPGRMMILQYHHVPQCLPYLNLHYAYLEKYLQVKMLFQN